MESNRNSPPEKDRSDNYSECAKKRASKGSLASKGRD